MKRFLLPFALAAAAALPLAASAQQPPMGPPTAAQRATMRANFQKMRQLHAQYRDQMLAALTPQHRQLLASIAGNLAVAEHPNYRGAVEQLDSALSPSEKSAVIGAAKSMRQQMRAMRPARSGGMPRPRIGTPRRPMHAPSAGRILLMMAGGHGMMWHGGPRR